MQRPAGLVTILLLVLGLVGTAAAAPVSVDVTLAGGATLGRLSGAREGSVVYFALDDVARLAGATVRRWGAGGRASLVARQRIVEVRRDSPHLSIDGRPATLTAPVRVRRGSWLVPGDFLVRALPTVLDSGIRVSGGAVNPAPGRPRVDPPPGSVRPAITTAPAGPVTPASLAPSAAPPSVRGAGPMSALETPRATAVAPERGANRPGTADLRYRSYPTYTRVVVEGPAALEPRLVERDGALVVTLPGLRRAGPAETRTVRDGLVATLELGETGGAPTLRVTFERAPAARRVYRLEDPHRLVLDFSRAGPMDTTGGTPVAAVPIRTIVIDPGHGGEDAGAIGPTGLQEKELTLDIARRVAQLLPEELGVRPLLTRTRDQFIALRARTALANRERADLFVSIHANAAPVTAANGAETYFLSSEATDNAARQAAARENQVIALEAGARGGSRDILRSILWDLVQSDFQQESSRVAEALQNQLDRAMRLPNRGVKQAPFYVLGGAAMPAVLVEIGFISNPEEEQRLRDDGYRDRIARALAAGLGAYMRGYDQRTRVESRR